MNLQFFTNIPATNNDPSVDQPNMLINNQSNNSIWNVDHIGYGQNLGGYHSTIHQTRFSNAQWNPSGNSGAGSPAPVNIPGIEQIFSLFYKGPGSASAPVTTQLFAQSGNGVNYQLTGSESSGQFGYAWIGGLLFQWGISTMNFGSSSSQASGNIVFSAESNITFAFPRKIFTVILILSSNIFNDSSDNTLSIINFTAGSVAPPSVTGFSYLFNGTNKTNYTQFYWVAIGN